ncbi:hypothetical protein GLOTRDRAFT_122375 [Gloeophyllum trabeum ATCC 11539]|uniref:Amine oxidase n=1 Tax=Gloeophyllum trabeum (strain ATCC 11539 / FP-39264 / Madison 617) TaxID=670483 RepID=S7PZJ2_GLOTA|nr:uncharacterized protein GLOTRDRAFT_122375 [Gloeophyllum trabeum ATCC 11539]EPQ53081.1 hypothetical protein GLOTRDRAFT_122375 [Gloeophyllum trabeum ATCC 11539]
MAPGEAFVVGTATGLHSQKVKAEAPEYQHPLDPLTAEEIAAITYSIRQHVATKTEVKAIRFLTCYLLPPPKKVVLAYLGIPLSPGAKPEPKSEIVRKAEADYIDVVTGNGYNAIVAFKDSKWEVESIELLPEGTQPQISPEELNQAEKIVRADERVQKLARDVGVEPHQLHADGWAIGYDDRFPKKTRIQQALLFARFGEHENLYAHPMDFIPIIDSVAGKVIHIDFPPSYNPEGKLSTQTTSFPPLDADPLQATNRERIAPPKEKFDFLPDLMAQNESQKTKFRDDVKPLHVVQPEGVSFKMDGHELEWQKWKMHIAFSHREGIALSTITYNDDGEVRPIFYRLSVAEMVVPYGAPEYPHPRKFAFDTGEYGMGTMANELSLGCDCLGQIHYLPGAYVANDGSAVVIKNVICIHEEDAGLLWKHTDWREGGRAHSVRSRRLVISMICTLANYEYVWNYYFYQDGNIELEIRLTGILQVYVAKPDEPAQYGTLVAPQVNAHYHQHIFSLRVDPMLDGLQNSVVESDIVPLPDAPTGSAANFAGNAFIVQDKVLKKQSEGVREMDLAKDRRWRIVNPARKHYSSGKEVSYAINMKGGATTLLARDDSWVATRAAFARKPLWVVKDVEGPKGNRMWPAGKYVPGTREEPAESLGKWVQSEESIENEDVVLFITVGTNHIPRPEDWPVMPVDHLRVAFKPHNFFKYNPSMDVPGGKDPRSVSAFKDTNGNLPGYSVQSCCSGN